MPIKRQMEYACFAELSKSEIEGVHFDRITEPRLNARVAVIAPHAGKIEPRTGLIAKKIAGSDFSLYRFVARRPEKKGRKSLHITSEHFDEPKCIKLVAAHEWVISIHGSSDAGEKVYLGGLDKQLVNVFKLALKKVGIHAQIDGHNFPGIHPNNICNLGISKKGVQIELTKSFRKGNRVATFIKAVRAVLLKTQSSG